MTLEGAEELTVEQLHSIRDRPLEDAYEDHDIGYDYLLEKLKHHGYFVADHGDDARDADEVFYGQGPDLASYKSAEAATSDDTEPLCYIEIKVKTDPEWFGRCNLRHFDEYCSFAGETDVPVFLWFALIDQTDDEKRRVHREAFIEVDGECDPYKEIVDISTSDVVFYEDDVETVNESSGLKSVAGSDIVGVRHDQTIVGYIPEVHGNEIVGLNDDDFRSWPHFLFRISE